VRVQIADLEERSSFGSGQVSRYTIVLAAAAFDEAAQES
jgi:hypothetical protein